MLAGPERSVGAAVGRERRKREEESKKAGEPAVPNHELRERLEQYVGQPMGPPAVAPDPVNLPMIRHWVDALDDRNPVYLDEEVAKQTRFGGIVAPPAMLQAWTMPRPKIEGIAERGGAPGEMTDDNPIPMLDRAGYVGTLATNSELEFFRYLRPGDQLHTRNEVESISPRKKTGLGVGYFVTWVTTFTTDDGEVVGRQLFRILKFDPTTIDLSRLGGTR
jgi:acyl dehydratase